MRYLLDRRSNPQVTKVQAQVSSVWVSTMLEGGHHRDSSGVWVVDRDCLILITVVLDNTLDQYVEWSAQEDIICQVVNDVELNV